MPPNQHSQDGRQRRQSANRRRAALACTTCRERKVRCDGAKPMCGQCQARKCDLASCVYHVISGSEKARQERAYVQSLQKQIGHLEQRVLQLSVAEARQSGDPDPSTPQAEHRPQEAPPKSSERPLNVGDPNSPHGRLYSGESPICPSPITAMGTAVPTLMPTESLYVADKYYGQSSVVSLTRGCPETTSPKQQGSLATAGLPLEGHHTPQWRTLDSASLLQDHFSLPPKEACDALLGVYWDSVHIFYPWVHVASFMHSYNLLWRPHDTQEDAENLVDVGLGGCNCPMPIFYCALNAMFALGCEFSSLSPQEKTTTSTIFYDRMKSLLQLDILDGGSLCHVQALLLMAQYLQCTHLPTRCWNIVGMAYRMSVGLGMHCNSSSGSMSVLEREIRNRIWHACIQMDLIVSMTMGRPAMAIQTHHVPLPMAIDDEFLSATSSECRQPDGVVSRTQFCVENLRLASILGQILSKVYGASEDGIGSSGQSEIQDVVCLDKSLDDFQSSLHPVLKWNQSGDLNDEANSLFTRQSNVLHARFLHLQLLLHRPGLSQYCSESAGSRERAGQQVAYSMSHFFQENSALKCTQVACELIRSIERATIEDATGAWWYSVFYLVSAGIVLVLAESQPSLTAKLDMNLLETSWIASTETLLRMAEMAHPSAKDYAVALKTMRQRYSGQQIDKETELNLTNAEISLGERAGRSQVEIFAADFNALSRPEYRLTDADLQLNADGTNGMSSGLFSPLLENWEAGLEGIMLPAHLFHDMYGGALLPNLF